MEIIFEGLLNLLILICVNIALGTYYSIGVQSFDFDWSIFRNGIAKGLIVAGSFVGLAYVSMSTDISEIGITPEMIMNSAIILYATKDLSNLSKILGLTSSDEIKEAIEIVEVETVE